MQIMFSQSCGKKFVRLFLKTFYNYPENFILDLFINITGPA